MNTYAYDWAGRETSETWYSSTVAAAAADSDGTISYAFDIESNMLSAANTADGSAVATYTYTNNRVGQALVDNIQLGDLSGSDNVVLGMNYDYNGNRTSLAANIGGSAVIWQDTVSGFSGGTNDFLDAFGYDKLGEMNSITQTTNGGNGVADKTVVLGYDNDQRVTSVGSYAADSVDDSDSGNEVVSGTYTFDNDSRLTDLTYRNASSTLLAGYHWDYNDNSVVSDEFSYADTSGSPSAGDHTTWAETSYGYDDDGELTSTSYSENFASAPSSNTSQTFDSNGNRTSNADGSTASSTNRMLFDGTYYYAYDANGNRVAKFLSSTGALDSTASDITIYAWNNANELTSAKNYSTWAAHISGTVSSESDFSYDAFTRMVSETAGDTTENFVYDGDNVALVLNGGGQVIDRPLYGPAVDQILATETVAPVDSGAQAAGTVNWLLTDNQQTVRDVAQYASGTTSIKDHLVYDSFGQETSQTHSAYQPIFTYDGMWQDPNTGLDYDHARWYDAVDGVFVSQDPLAFGGGQTNVSAFVANSPTNGTDPSGMDDSDTGGTDGTDPTLGGAGAMNILKAPDRPVIPTLPVTRTDPNPPERFYPATSENLPPQQFVPATLENVTQQQFVPGAQTEPGPSGNPQGWGLRNSNSNSDSGIFNPNAMAIMTGSCPGGPRPVNGSPSHLTFLWLYLRYLNPFTAPKPVDGVDKVCRVGQYTGLGLTAIGVTGLAGVGGSAALSSLTGGTELTETAIFATKAGRAAQDAEYLEMQLAELEEIGMGDSQMAESMRQAIEKLQKLRDFFGKVSRGE